MVDIVGNKLVLCGIRAAANCVNGRAVAARMDKGGATGARGRSWARACIAARRGKLNLCAMPSRL